MFEHSYIYILTAVALLFLAFMVRHSDYIEKRRNHAFILSIMADVMVLLGYVGRDVTGTYPSVFIGAFSNLIIYGFAPFIPLFMLYPLAESNRKMLTALFVVEAVELALVLSSLFTGLLFQIDGTGAYSRGPLYLVSFVWGGILYFIWGFLNFREYRDVEPGDKLKLAAVFVLELAGIILQAFDGTYKLVYIGAAFVLFVYYAFIIETDGKYDKLTGCFSNIHYMNSLEALEKKTECSILMADVNGLKATNDRHGHDSGNKLISAVARGLKEAAGDNGKVYRVGGDEFIVIVNSRDGMLISEIGEKADSFCSKMEDEEGMNISASFGIAVREDGESFASALKRADEDMYEDKRNFYCHSETDRRSR